MLRRFSFSALFSFIFVGSVFGQATEPFNTEDGVGIKGYDPVAYFTEEKPVRGDTAHVYEWQDVRWLFSSAEHKELFIQNPEAYAPQFGGYCAWAASRNYTADTDPEAWTVDNGKLYLNYNKRVRRNWSKDQTENIKKGHTNWPGLRADLQKQ